MVQIKEFRIVMPVSLDEYQVGQMYTLTTMQQQATTSSEGVEIVESKVIDHEVYGKCRYTYKIYRLQSKIPSWLTTFAPKDALVLYEESWNAFPRCKTVLKCSYFSKFSLTIDTFNKLDRGNSENVHDLEKEQLEEKQVEVIDIAKPESDYWSLAIGRNQTDFSKFRSEKALRGPLLDNWQEKCDPVMTSYKLVTVDAPYWGFGYRLEQALIQGERALFLQSHRNMFSWIDEWFDVTRQGTLPLEIMRLSSFSSFPRVEPAIQGVENRADQEVPV